MKSPVASSNKARVRRIIYFSNIALCSNNLKHIISFPTLTINGLDRWKILLMLITGAKPKKKKMNHQSLQEPCLQKNPKPIFLHKQLIPPFQTARSFIDVCRISAQKTEFLLIAQVRQRNPLFCFTSSCSVWEERAICFTRV